MLYITLADLTKDVFIHAAFVVGYLFIIYLIVELVYYQDRKFWRQFEKWLDEFKEMEGIK